MRAHRRTLTQKCISLLLLLALAAAALTPAALAAEDPVDDFAAALGSFQEEITVPVRDFDALMQETFSRYPELFLYYGGCTYLSVPDGLELTVTYQNTQVPREEIRVVGSGDELMAVLGLAMADKEQAGIYVAYERGLSLSNEEINALMDRLYQDYYLLWMGLYNYTYSGQENQSWGMRWHEFTLRYWEDADADTLSRWRDGTEQALLQLSSTLFAQDMPDYYKALLIHDYLVDTCRYDQEDLVRTDWENHIPYGALVDGSCVCQGYAESARLLLDAAGVENVCVTGTAGGGNHMWNALQLGGEWYMMDITWDDPTTTDGSDIKRYDYFNVTSSQLAQDHQWEAADFPDCTGTDLNYEAVRALVDGDSTQYTDYSSRLVRTQAIERAELEAILAQGEAEDTPGPEDTTEPDETTEPDDTIQPDDSTEPEEPDEPEDGEDGLDLQLVIPLREEDQRWQPASLSGWLIAALIVLAVVAGVSALAFHLVSATRVMNARERREEQRERRLASGKVRRRER